MSVLLLNLLMLIAAFLGVVYLHFRKCYGYWKSRNIPHETPKFPFGSLQDSTTKNLGVIINEYYQKTKNERFFGLWFFHKPTLLINDLELVKNILVRDFMSFQDHGVYHDPKVDPLSAHLFAIEGTVWRNKRVKMTPTFTSGKMKMIFPTVKECGLQLTEVLKKYAEGGEVVEVKDIVARYSTDVIASCAFGIESNSLKNPNATFRVMGRKLFESTWSSHLRNIATFIVPGAARLFKVRATPKKFADFFIGVLKETINFRQANNVSRNDFLQLLIQMMNQGYVESADRQENGEKANEKQEFTFEQAIPEAFVFFLGGFETTSATLHFLLYELAMNMKVQDKLREEILETLAESDGEMTYKIVHKMDYLERTIQETLRKHPPASFLFRVCTNPYRIPDSDIVIEKGTSVTIPICGFQMDERYFPNPEVFDPDRFLEEEKASRNHYAYLPFGEGPRVCIGQRFAMMQMKVAVISILSNYRVTVAEGETRVPLEYDHKVFLLSAKGGMPLRISTL